MSDSPYKVVYTRFADDDITSAAQWFRQVGAPEVIDKFFRVIAAAEIHLSRNPHIYPVVQHDIRVVHLRPFKHGLYFRILDNRVLVIACQHSSRNPASIRHELTERT